MEGTRISHYQLGRMLGRGGMGEVYQALDLDLDRQVALKFIAPELAADPDSLRRFEREARAAAAIHHPHIATLFSFDRSTEKPFIAMELLSGGSLRDRIVKGPLPLPEALAIGCDVARALAVAHRRDIVHRDIKPENLRFSEEGTVKVTDFGLARAAQASRLTTTGSTLGTAAYMAPESVRTAAAGSVVEAGAPGDPGGQERGAPGDVFALGVVLHEMLTAELPFAGDSPLAQLYNIANQDPRRVRALRPEVPQAVEDLLLRVLEKDPARRPTAAEVADELARLTGVSPIEPGFEAPADAAPVAGAMVRGAGVTEELEVERRSTRELVGTEPQPPERHKPAIPRALIIVMPVLGLVVGTFFTFQYGFRRPARRATAVTLNNQGHDSLRAGSLGAAQRLFESALETDPGYGEAMLNLGVVLHRRQRDTEAAALFARALREHARDPRLASMAHDGLAEIDMRSEAWESAVGHLETALKLDSSRAGAYNNLGYALVRAGRSAAGMEVLERGLNRFDTEAALHKNAGLAAFQLGDDRRALVALDRAMLLDPRYAEALALRARVKARLDDVPGAHADLATLERLGHDPLELGMLRAEIGEAQARVNQQRIHREHPDGAGSRADQRRAGGLRSRARPP